MATLPNFVAAVRERARQAWQGLAAELFDDNGLAAVFLHVRNVLSASLVVAAGLYAAHHRPLWPAPAVWTVQLAGVAVTTLGVVLLLLNLADGLRRLSRRGYPRLLHGIAAILYLGLTLRVVQVIAYFRHIA